MLLDGQASDALEPVLGAGDRLAMLLERIDELSLERHDFGGSANALLGGFIRRIDRLKAEPIGAEDYAPLGGRSSADSAERGRSSASSPRSTARTSGCWPRPGRATAAI